jgi:hypothetical protein
VDVTAGDRWSLNHAVYEPGQRRGHYESFYQRANHPSLPLAFWIRYTMFAPDGKPDEAVGELWATVFDGTKDEHEVEKVVLPMTECHFDRSRFDVRVGDSALGPERSAGSAGQISWDLTYSAEGRPLLLFPKGRYSARLPKAKSLVAAPIATYTGELRIGDRLISVDDWVGNQCHNWGTRHTDSYAFVQVCGFDNARDTLLEAGTARASFLGPLMTPVTTFVVLRHGGTEYRLNRLQQALRATGSYDWFDWDFTTGNDDVELIGHVHAPPEAFVALQYDNPPGGHKQCLTTALASCELTIVDQATGERTTLRTSQRALLDFVTDRTDHGLPVRA